MSLRKYLSVTVLFISSLFLSSCNLVNASTRPVGQFQTVTDALNAYEKGQGMPYDYEFIRSFGALPKMPCEAEEFDGWEKNVPEDGESTTYSRKLSVFECETEISVGIRNENSKIIGICFVFSDNGKKGPFAITGGLWKALSEKAGSTYEAYLDGEAAKAKTIAELLEAGEENHSYRGIWPRNSIKWSVMLDYSVEEGKQKLAVYFL